MTLTLDMLANLSDLSAIPMVMLSYAPVNNFTLSFQVGAYLGCRQPRVHDRVQPERGAVTNNALFAILGVTVNF